MDLITLVQNHEYEKHGKTIKELVESKHAGFENGWSIENGRVVFWYSPTVKVKDNPLRSPAKYVWEVSKNKVKAFNGRALELEK